MANLSGTHFCSSRSGAVSNFHNNFRIMLFDVVSMSVFAHKSIEWQSFTSYCMQTEGQAGDRDFEVDSSDDEDG